MMASSIGCLASGLAEKGLTFLISRRRRAAVGIIAPGAPQVPAEPGKARLSRRRAVLAGLAVLGAFLFGSGAAHAAVLVSNIEHTTFLAWQLIAGNDVVQRFSTGRNAANLTSIEIRLRNRESDAISPPAMKLFTGTISSTEVTLGSEVATLTGPATIRTGESTVTYNAPANTSLAASTTYFVFIEGTGDVQMRIHFDASVVSGKPGWGIETFAYRAGDSTGPFQLDTPTVLLRVNGTEVVFAPGAPQNLAATAGGGQVVLNWAAPASDGGSFGVAIAAGGSPSSLRETMTFTSRSRCRRGPVRTRASCVPGACRFRSPSRGW